MKKNVLIVGGTSGIGLRLALNLRAQGNKVFVTGRDLETARNTGLTLFHLSIGDDYEDLYARVNHLIGKLPTIDLYVHAAGFYQEGLLSELSAREVLLTINITLLTPVCVLQSLMSKQGILDGFIAITSTSATRARAKEPVYCSTKAGLSMLAWSLAYDPHISRVLEVAPSGTDSPFWRGREKDRQGSLTTAWVAQTIEEEWQLTKHYRSVILQRNPDKVLVQKDE